MLISLVPNYVFPGLFPYAFTMCASLHRCWFSGAYHARFTSQHLWPQEQCKMIAKTKLRCPIKQTLATTDLSNWQFTGWHHKFPILYIELLVCTHQMSTLISGKPHHLIADCPALLIQILTQLPLLTFSCL